MKKIFIVIWIIFFSTTIIAKDEKKQTKEVYLARGYIGIEFDLKLDAFETQIKQNQSLNVKQNSFFFLSPFRIVANTGDYKIDMNIELFYDFAKISQYYYYSSDFLKQNEMYQFSFFNIDLSYSVFHNKTNFSLLIGGKFAHYGFLSPYFDKNKVYILSLSPLIKIRWIITKFALFNFDLEIPIIMYSNNVKEFFQIRNSMYFIFDAFENIGIDLSRSRLFYGIGIEVLYTTMKVLNQYDITQLNIRPFIKVGLAF